MQEVCGGACRSEGTPQRRLTATGDGDAPVTVVSDASGG